MRALRAIILVFMLCVVNCVTAQSVVNHQNSLSKDYSPIDYAEVQRQLERAAQPTFWEKLAKWFAPDIGNKPLEERKIIYDGYFGVGYTQETSLIILATGIGRYSLNRKDTSLPHSTTALTALTSVNGYFRLMVGGELVMSKKDRLNFNIGGGVMPVRFWGLGYDAARVNRVAKYERSDLSANVDYVRRVVGGLSLGVGADFRYIKCGDMSDLALRYLQDGGADNLSVTTTGVGAELKYNGRYVDEENITKGVFVQLSGDIHPKVLGSHSNTLWHVEATVDYYQPLWRGGVLAFDFYADMWSKNTPWQLWAKVGGDNRMRGYYYGRYTDKKMVTAQMEFRQRIYGVLSGVVWGGVGSVFPEYKYFDIDDLLPNYGVGIRVAVARNLSFRIDYGFGRNAHGLIINVNEAF